MEYPFELYHYSSFDNGIKILKSKKLKLSSIEDFNDPFECLMASKISKELATYSVEELKILLEKLKEEKESTFFVVN